MALKPTESSTVKLEPLLLFRDWLHEQEPTWHISVHSAYSRAALNIGILQRWLGWIEPVGRTPTTLVYLFIFHEDGNIEFKKKYDLRDPSSFEEMLQKLTTKVPK